MGDTGGQAGLMRDFLTLNPGPMPKGDPAKMFRVKVVRASVRAADESPASGVPVVSFMVTAPRCILAEINTHRALSRSSESSRAIPAAARIGQVANTPYRPLRLGKRVKGMGAGADLEEDAAELAASGWEYARQACIYAADRMAAAGLAKEELNRVLEPWALCRTVLTGTDWANFYFQRTHPKAHPAFMFLARAMYVAAARVVPEPLRFGEWHLPFITAADVGEATRYCRDAPILPAEKRPDPAFGGWAVYHLCRWSAARCARVSYGLRGGLPATPEADDRTWATLVGFGDDTRYAAWMAPANLTGGAAWDSDPMHPSPLEHQCSPLHPAWLAGRPHLRSNLREWLQFRKLFAAEVRREFAPPPEVVAAWAAAVPPEVFDGDPLY